MMSWRTWVAGLATVLLAGCGGGGGSDAGTPSQGPANTASDLTLVLSAPVLSNAGSDTITATVTAVDANRNAVPNTSVTLSVDANATVQVSGPRTGSDGKLTGVIGLGSDRTLRKITVTAVSGSIRRTAEIQVTSGSTNGAPKAADLMLSLSSLQLVNAGTQTVTVTAVAVDANRNTVAKIPVTLSVDNGATIKVDGSVTDEDGKLTGAIGIGEDKTNRVINVTAVSDTLVKTVALQVTGAQIKTTLLPPVLSPGQAGKVQYRLLDSSGNPVPRKAITIIGADAVQQTGTSDLNGDFEYNYTAPAAAGELTIRASAIGVDTVSTVIVASTSAIPRVTIPVQSASVSASPNVVAINRVGTTNQSSIRALFLGALNKPIQNVRVRFDLAGDLQSVGGGFTSGSTMVYSDANGIATTSYVPGGRFSPTDGVTVRACWDYGDFPEGACPNAATNTLTVTSDSLSVSIGTNDEITEDDTKLNYVKRYVVQVVDSSGRAVSDVEVTAQLDLLRYAKGTYNLATVAGRQRWVQATTAICDNEDLNRNGAVEVYSNGVNEDANGSGNLTNGRPALEPRRGDVAHSIEGSSRTNTSGTAVVRIAYPKSVATWVQFNLMVGASGVAGTEGRANYVSYLPAAADAINRVDADPPFLNSPYGVRTSGTVQAAEPGSTRQPVMLCTDPN